MALSAYQARHDGTDFVFDGRDDAAGILGTFRPGEAPPVVTAETLEELEQKVRAHLGEEPAAFLYLADGNGHVYRIMINKKYHAAIGSAERRTAISVALLVFSVTCLITVRLLHLVHGRWFALLVPSAFTFSFSEWAYSTRSKVL